MEELAKKVVEIAEGIQAVLEEISETLQDAVYEYVDEGPEGEPEAGEAPQLAAA